MATESIEIGLAPLQIGFGADSPENLMFPAGVLGETPGTGQAVDISLKAVREYVLSNPSPETEISELISRAGGLDIGSLKGHDVLLSAMRSDVVENAPNLFPHNGRFIDIGEQGNDASYNSNTAPFSVSGFASPGFISPYNGSTVAAATEAGRIHYNNDNNGGASGLNNAIALRFANAMGIPKQRYGPTFAIAEFTNGGGTAGGEIDGLYRFWTKNSLTRAASGFAKSLGFWMESDGDISFASSAYDLEIYGRRDVFVDGVRATSEHPFYSGARIKIPANTVFHFAASEILGGETPYTGNWCKFAGGLNQKVRVSAMKFVSGYGQIRPSRGIH